MSAKFPRGGEQDLFQPAVYIYMYITILVEQVYWYISRVSGERLQDHWSSGLRFVSVSGPEVLWSERV